MAFIYILIAAWEGLRCGVNLNKSRQSYRAKTLNVDGMTNMLKIVYPTKSPFNCSWRYWVSWIWGNAGSLATYSAESLAKINQTALKHMLIRVFTSHYEILTVLLCSSSLDGRIKKQHDMCAQHPRSWSEMSLCAQWLAKDQRFLHVDSDDWFAQTDPSLCWAYRSVCWFCHWALVQV